MKIGLGIATFSGAEFLKPMIRALRCVCDYVVCTYSQTSYCGDPAPKYLLPLLQQLKSEGVIDDYIDYHPHPTKSPPQKQLNARQHYNILRQRCKINGCTHFLACDCDEFYIPEQVLKIVYHAEKHDMLIVPLVDYVNKPNYRSLSTAQLHVPFIHNINCVVGDHDYGVLIDTSRLVKSRNPRVLKDVAMHHMTAVRYNETELRRKFQGHSHFMLMSRVEKEKYIQSVYTNRDVKDVGDLFGILEYWKNEFGPFYSEVMK